MAALPVARPRLSTCSSTHAVKRRRTLLAQAASRGGSEATTAAGPDVETALAVLRQALRTKQVPPDEVLAAMQQAEAAHSQQSQVQGFPAALSGTWRLVFSTPSPIPQWQYIPVQEDAVIDVEAGTLDLVSLVGPINVAFKGTCTVEQDASGAYCLRFGFSTVEAKWFGRWDTRSELKERKEKTYTFFLLDGDLAAANSSGGPKTLMWRVK